MSDSQHVEIDVDHSRKRKRFRTGCVVAILLMGVLFAFLVYAVREAREAARRMQCVPKQLALALHLYHDEFGSLPPAYTTDAEGNPLHSWRVLVLPYIQEQELYNKIRFDEPWDSPHNSRFHDEMPGTFHCPSRPKDETAKGLTPFQMIIGPDTISDGPNGTNFSDTITRQKNGTILFVEASVPVPWMKPVDLPQSALQNGIVSSVPRKGRPVVQGIGSPHYNRKRNSVFGKKIPGANVAMVDGSCQFFTTEISPEELLKMSRIRDPKQ